MAAAGTAVIRILSDTSDLTRGLRRAEGQLNGFQKKAASVGKASGALGGILGGVLVANLGLGLKGIMENEDALARYDAALRNSTKAVQSQRDGLIAYSNEMQRNTKFTQEDILAIGTQIAQMQSLSGVVSAGAVDTMGLTSIIANMATAMGTDGASAANLLAKAMANPAMAGRALKQVGVDLTAGEEAKLKTYAKSNDVLAAQEFILGKVKSATNGLADAAGDTMSGKIIRAKNSVGELQESMAAALLPAIERVTAAAFAFSEWAQRHPALIRNVVIGVGVLAGALIGLSVVMWATALINPYTAAIAGVVAVVAGIVYLSTRFQGFAAFMGNLMNVIYKLWYGRWFKMFELVASAAGAFFGKIGGFLGKIPGPIGDVGDAMGKLADGANAAKGAFGALADFNPGDTFVKGIDAIGKFKIPKPNIPAASKIVYNAGKGLGGTLAEGVASGTKAAGTKVEDAVKKVVQQARDRVKSAKDLAKDIRAAFAYTLNAMTFDDTSRSATLQYNLDEQLKKIKAFRVAVEALKKKGLRGSALTKLVEGGPDNLAAAQEILNTNGVGKVNATSAAIDAESKKLAYGEVMRRTGVDLNRDRPVKVVFDVTGADKEMKALIKKIVRTDGGGDVAVAFGRK